MKTAIVIRGHAGQGKSATVREIYNLIMANHGGVHANLVIPEGLTSGDIKIVILAQGKLIGIEAQGDPKSRLFRSLPEFVQHKCDIIICSSRTRGETVWAVNDLNRNHQYQIVWSTNHRSKHFGHEVLNQLSGQQIVDLMIQNSIL